MEEKKECIVCGNKFTPKNKKGVYCSSVCRQKDYRRRLAPVIIKGRELLSPDNAAAPNKAVASHKPENSNQFAEPNISIQNKLDALNGAKKEDTDIQKSIDDIKAEKIPKERDTPMGRKVWQIDQQKRIQELQNKLK